MRVDINANGPVWHPDGLPRKTAEGHAATVFEEETAALLRQASRAARSALDTVSSNLQFLTDPHSGRTVVQVVDAQTRQVIRQLPSEEALAITRAMDRLQSLLVREQA